MATWQFVYGNNAIVWDWRSGPPDVRFLGPARRTAADSMSRHAPVCMQCLTTGAPLLLESGLEYDLARDLDRDPTVSWIAAQPALVTFPDGSRHVPDLVSESTGGNVVIWDARPRERRDDTFLRVAEQMTDACAEVGWGYELYDTPSTVRRLNLLWLACFRHRPQWPHHDARTRLLDAAMGPLTVADATNLDDGDGHLIAFMWHLLWTGELVVNLDAPITATTPIHHRESSDD